VTPDPVRAWAAVAPDGTLLAKTISQSRADVMVTVQYKFSHTGDASAWAVAVRAGWRVVPIEIRVMEESRG